MAVGSGISSQIEAQGFVVLAPQTLTCRGVEFINYRMERDLAELDTGAGSVVK